jgi:hypothetical protein
MINADVEVLGCDFFDSTPNLIISGAIRSIERSRGMNIAVISRTIDTISIWICSAKSVRRLVQNLLSQERHTQFPRMTGQH